MKQYLNNYRIIPARLPHVLGISAILISLGLTVLLFTILHDVYTEYNYEKEQYGELEQKFSYWNSVIIKHPQFPTAYYEAAVYAHSLGEREQALKLLQQALIIDPNFSQAESLMQTIGE